MVLIVVVVKDDDILWLWRAIYLQRSLRLAPAHPAKAWSWQHPLRRTKADTRTWFFFPTFFSFQLFFTLHLYT